MSHSPASHRLIHPPGYSYFRHAARGSTERLAPRTTPDAGFFVSYGHSMLRRLHIRGIFVIVDGTELHFVAGFGALTGETGAGKSILLDALGLADGRSGRKRRHGSGGAVARRDERRNSICRWPTTLTQWLDEQAIEVDDDILLLQVAVDQTGRSRAWINGGVSRAYAVTREVGGWLADIPWAARTIRCCGADAQRILLDTYMLASEIR